MLHERACLLPNGLRVAIAYTLQRVSYVFRARQRRFNPFLTRYGAKASPLGVPAFHALPCKEMRLYYPDL